MKRSISLKDIKRIKEADLSGMSHLDYARDMFVFSFCTRGMSFIDMAYLRKKMSITDTLFIAGERPGRCLPLSGRGRCKRL